ncbi:hypothetical protein QBC39DRAFT_355451 [Podospora conica]|nr:hypothetical protein QBC39DRAFT_355451 [Schizothecium conicum]
MVEVLLVVVVERRMGRWEDVRRRSSGVVMGTALVDDEDHHGPQRESPARVQGCRRNCGGALRDGQLRWKQISPWNISRRIKDFTFNSNLLAGASDPASRKRRCSRSCHPWLAGCRLPQLRGNCGRRALLVCSRTTSISSFPRAIHFRWGLSTVGFASGLKRRRRCGRAVKDTHDQNGAFHVFLGGLKVGVPISTMSGWRRCHDRSEGARRTA